MIDVALVVAATLILRPPPIEAVLLITALLEPALALLLVLAFLFVSAASTRPEPHDEASFLHTIALEMRAGSNLRSAIVDASRANTDFELAPAVRLAQVGAPVALIAGALGDALPEYGDVTEAAVRIAGATGGQVAAVFESLAQVAAEDREMRRETKAATGQARVSSWIVGGLPVGFLIIQAGTGRLSELLQSGIGIAVLVLGGTLLGLGVATVILMLRRALA